MPQSGSANDVVSEAQAKNFALALRRRADKIRRGLAPRDATEYIEQMDKEWLRTSEEGRNIGNVRADFDNPDSMEQTADFFESSGGVTLIY